MQQLALWLTLIGVAALAAIFAAVARGASQRGVPERAPAGGERLRGWLFAAAGAAFVPITALSLGALPYGAPPEDAVIVEAVGHQWYWELSRTTVPAHRPVVFRVRSADVNHGFAVYDPDMRVVGQTQAMPGYENQLVLRFERPGSYRILCLEYCGSVHHGMQAALEVVEESR
jgi:cytochrome c oxidase subunit 2